jgi:hypothetical protein
MFSPKVAGKICWKSRIEGRRTENFHNFKSKTITPASTTYIRPALKKGHLTVEEIFKFLSGRHIL